MEDGCSVSKFLYSAMVAFPNGIIFGISPKTVMRVAVEENDILIHCA